MVNIFLGTTYVNVCRVAPGNFLYGKDFTLATLHADGTIAYMNNMGYFRTKKVVQKKPFCEYSVMELYEIIREKDYAMHNLNLQTLFEFYKPFTKGYYKYNNMVGFQRDDRIHWFTPTGNGLKFVVASYTKSAKYEYVRYPKK